jgi:hypothetical protein
MRALIAYIDDSASDVGDQVLVLAGYVSSVENWAAFSRAWKAALLTPPRIEYLHMVEAQNLRDQFAGWSEAQRNAKLASLAEVIVQYDLRSVSISQSRRDYAQIVAPVAPYPLKSPYFGCFWDVIQTLARYLDNYDTGGVLPPVDFVFDEHSGMRANAAIWFEWLKQSSPPEWRRYIGREPRFEDDEKVVELQAADMLAWHIRRDHEKDGKEAQPLTDELRGEGVGLHVDAETLKLIAKHFGRVPNVDLVQTKTRWQETARAVRAMTAAGVPPPDTNLLRMRWKRFVYEFERISKRLRGRIKFAMRRSSWSRTPPTTREPRR